MPESISSFFLSFSITSSYDFLGLPDLFCATTFSLRTSAIQPVLHSTCPNHLFLCTSHLNHYARDGFFCFCHLLASFNILKIILGLIGDAALVKQYLLKRCQSGLFSLLIQDSSKGDIPLQQSLLSEIKRILIVKLKTSVYPPSWPKSLLHVAS